MEEHQTLATITLQNYFRLYEKLGGMTGTAKTEEKEFVEIYGLNVVEIPTNVDVARDDKNDLIFKTVEAKFNAVVDDIKERNEKGQPVLVGTIAVETSEYLSELLKRKGVPHNVLNAKEHAREAEIIKDAGQVGAVTIATNMAGRGVDIKIDDQVRELGGLYVLGTERHEARRIDNQLRGRSGRQGDPGETRFYLSGMDDLVRMFAGDRIHNIMERFKLPDDQPMEASILSRQIENAQKKVEEQNFVARKNVLKYDDVMNVQRQVIYEQRNSVLHGEDLSEEHPRGVAARGDLGRRRRVHFEELTEEWDLEGLVAAMENVYGTGVTADELKGLDREAIIAGVPRRRARRLRRAREGARPDPGRADARSRAVHRPADGRHPLARAPREHGLHARGHPPARDGAERPARRVPQRGPPDVPGPHPRDPRRGRDAALPRRGDARRRGSAQLQQSPAANGAGNGALSYEHQSLAGAEAILAAGGRRPPPVAGGGSVATPVAAKPKVNSELENIGPQRPLLVRLGQEVQEVPRRLTGRALTAGSAARRRR